MARKRMIIRGMTCPTCNLHVQRALQKVGATAVVADFRKGEALFDIGKGVGEAELLGAVAAAGYEPVRIEGAGEETWDLVVIGSGSAAFAAAIHAREKGARVLMIERGTIGGTCVNVGCIPSKALLRRAEVHHLAASSPYPGVSTRADRVDLAAVVADKDRLVAGLRKEKYEDLLGHYGIELKRGEAAFRDGESLTVAGETVRGRAFVVATGSSPVRPELPGLGEVDYLDSTAALALTEIPSRLIVLGAGFVALELGQYFARLGSRVSLVQRGENLLRAFPPNFGTALREALEKEGLTFHTGSRVLRVERAEDGVRVHLERGGATEVLTGDRLLVAVGRTPNTAALGLERAGVRVGERGEIVVDEHLRTANPRIFAAGDVTGGPQFVYVAAYEGRTAAENALGGDEAVDLRVVPSVIFTSPAAARVGLGEAEARSRGLRVKSAEIPVGVIPRAQVNGEEAGLFRLIAEEETDRILGAEILAENAGEVIYAALLAVKFGLRVGDLVATLAPYLTMAEGLRLTAQTFDKDVSELSCCAY